jgi:hypothetical protein
MSNPLNLHEERGYNGMFLFYNNADYDQYGFDENGNEWQHFICIMDDFGEAVPVSGFYHGWDNICDWHGERDFYPTQGH